MQTLPAFLTALLTLLSVVVGASLQYVLSKSGERRKQLEALRSQAYVDYLRAVAQAKYAGADQSKRSEILAAAADAKARLCVYGERA